MSEINRNENVRFDKNLPWTGNPDGGKAM